MTVYRRRFLIHESARIDTNPKLVQTPLQKGLIHHIEHKDHKEKQSFFSRILRGSLRSRRLNAFRSAVSADSCRFVDRFSSGINHDPQTVPSHQISNPQRPCGRDRPGLCGPAPGRGLCRGWLSSHRHRPGPPQSRRHQPGRLLHRRHPLVPTRPPGQQSKINNPQSTIPHRHHRLLRPRHL